MSNPSTNELELRKAFNHTAKLVPMSQREIFLDECVRITNRLMEQATREARIEELAWLRHTSFEPLEENDDTDAILDEIIGDYLDDRIKQLEQQTKEKIS